MLVLKVFRKLCLKNQQYTFAAKDVTVFDRSNMSADSSETDPGHHLAKKYKLQVTGSLMFSSIEQESLTQNERQFLHNSLSEVTATEGNCLIACFVYMVVRTSRKNISQTSLLFNLEQAFNKLYCEFKYILSITCLSNL